MALVAALVLAPGWLYVSGLAFLDAALPRKLTHRRPLRAPWISVGREPKSGRQAGKTLNAVTGYFEPWCVEVSRVSGGVGRCRGSVEAVSVDTGVGVSGSVGLQCRGSVGAPGQWRCAYSVKVSSSVGVSECRGVGVSGRCRGVGVSMPYTNGKQSRCT